MTNWGTRQNGDGGWPYGRGVSWTEPTVYVLLAQAAASEGAASSEDAVIAGVRAQPDRESFLKGAKFLGSIARKDGGYSPQPGVEESTWVTALVALLPEDALSERQRRQAIDWLAARAGQESDWRYRLKQRMNGNKDEFPRGWPWFPGAAAWVIPTSFGILAFERALRGQDALSGVLRERVADARTFLLGRMCADGGWNHGANRALGRDGDSYPETTGIALLALHEVAGDQAAAPQIERAKAAARKHLTTCRTAEGIAWLRMGLGAHGEAAVAAFEPVCRTNMDEALLSLAGAVRNPLLV
jgi:hypothetical protein